MKFNLKKTAQNYNDLLDKDRKSHDHAIPTEGNTELQLKHNNRKDKDASIPFEKQLKEVRKASENVVLEKQFGDKHRDDRTHNKNAKSQDLVAEAYDQEKLKAYKKAQEGQDRDTSFWDEYTGFEGSKKIKGNVQKSQLPNHPSRYKDLKKDLKAKVEDYVMANLQNADKAIFHIFASCAYKNQKVGQTEINKVQEINETKAKILASYENFMRTGKWIDVFNKTASVELVLDPNGRVSVQENGETIDEFESVKEAKMYYPEAELGQSRTPASPASVIDKKELPF